MLIQNPCATTSISPTYTYIETASSTAMSKTQPWKPRAPSRSLAKLGKARLKSCTKHFKTVFCRNVSGNQGVSTGNQFQLGATLRPFSIVAQKTSNIACRKPNYLEPRSRFVQRASGDVQQPWDSQYPTVNEPRTELTNLGYHKPCLEESLAQSVSFKQPPNQGWDVPRWGTARRPRKSKWLFLRVEAGSEEALVSPSMSTLLNTALLSYNAEKRFETAFRFCSATLNTSFLFSTTATLAYQ